MIGDVIYTLLSNDADVSALVSTRIYPSLAIENVVYPYIVYETTGNEPTDDKDGKSSIDTLDYDIEIYTETLDQLNDLSTKVRNVLDRYSGTVSGKQIQSMQYTADNTGYSDDNRVYLKMQNYDIRYFTIYNTLSRVTDLAVSSNSPTSISLSWSDVATGETGYEVWRSTNFIEWTLITTTAADATSYTNSGLSNNVSYAYKIRPTDGTDGGEWSNVVIGNTESSGASGIAYKRPTLTGQITSYRTGDDGWHLANGTYDYTPPSNPVSYAQLDTTDPSPFITLISNNAFGNKNRFTDELGTQIYSAGLVIDHLTGLMWRKSDVTDGGNWDDSIDNAHGLSFGGYSDWRMSNINEFLSISDFSISNNLLDYAPFNNNTNALYYTSTTYAKNTVRFKRITPNVSVVSDNNKTDAGRSMYVCRNFYT